MVNEAQKPRHVIVMTDLAFGDDYGAVLALCAYAAMNKQVQFSFVGTYGNRSTQETTHNLLGEIPYLWKQLGQSKNTCPQIYSGADRPINSQLPYEVGSHAVERLIHGEFPIHNGTEAPSTKPVEELYRALKQGNIPVALLSLGAPTETVTATRALGSLIQYSVAMLGTLTTQGNTGSHKEANATHDPVANKKLLTLSEKKQIPFTLVPLDCTEKRSVLIDPKMLREMENKLGKNSFGFQTILSIAGINSIYGGFYLKRSRHSARFPYNDLNYTGVPLHDLTAAMVLIDHLQNKHDLLFRYSKKTPLHADKMGNIGVVRDYMMPHAHVDIAGPITKNYWSEIMKLLKRYH